MSTEIYHNGQLVDADAIYDLAKTYNLHYQVVKEVVEQVREVGEPSFSSYSGEVRDNVLKLGDSLSTDAIPDSPAPRKEEDIIADKAAVSLIKACAPEDVDHFYVSDHGFCTINEENPPTIEQGLVVASQIMQTETLGDKIKDKAAWMLGSIVVEMENLFGEEFNISQICEMTDKARNTVETARSVYLAFKDKPFDLSYTHHKEAHFKKVPHQVKMMTLRKAELYGLSAHDVRDLLSIYQKIEDETVLKNIRSTDGAKDLIGAYKDIKATFYIYEDGQLYKHRGLTTEPPEGKIVINIKDDTYSIDGANPINIEKWTTKTENT